VTEEDRKAAYNAAYNELRRFTTQFSQFVSDEEGGLELGVDRDALLNLSRSYIDDLRRYTTYHNAPIPDHARRCAYLCKWIMKFRPLVVRNPIAPTDREFESFAIMVNEIFATWCVSILMMVEWDEISINIRELFLYSLRHRSNSEDTYILFFAQLCQI